MYLKIIADLYNNIMNLPSILLVLNLLLSLSIFIYDKVLFNISRTSIYLDIIILYYFFI